VSGAWSSLPLTVAPPWFPLHFVPAANLVEFLPELVVAAGMVLVILTDLFISPAHRGRLAVITGAVLLAGFCVAVGEWIGRVPAGPVFDGAFAADRFGLFADFLILLVALAVTGLSPSYLRRRRLESGEYYVLLLASVTGMMVLAGATNLIVVFLGIELLSIPLYVLCALNRDDGLGQEAAIKYLLLGGFASAFLVYGMALVYGEAGATNLAQIHRVLLHGALAGRADPMLLAGLALIGVGLAFKVSAVPFHWWTPDVYQGAPVLVTTFMSVATKVAGFAAFLRIFSVTFGTAQSDWTVPVALVAIASMVYGNVVALAQRSLKRMLAYSGIAQAGYILIGVAVGQPDGTGAALYYLAAYAAMNLGAFGILTALSGQGEDCDDYGGLVGLARRQPLLASLMSLFLLSLAGFPLTAGFFGKFFLFSAAIHDGQIPLALWGVVTSAVSLFYYLRVILAMFTEPAVGAERVEVAGMMVDGAAVGRAQLALVRPALGTQAILLVLAAATLLLGVFPALVYSLVQGIHVVAG